MLGRVLDKLREGGTHTVEGLARELGTTPALVEAVLEDLARRGYLKPLAGSCSGQCRSCPIGGGCTVAGAARGWTLTTAADQRSRGANALP